MKEIPLQGKWGMNKSTLVDDDDYEYFFTKKVYLSKTAYPCINLNGKPTKLHRLIMNAEKGEYIDHINHNRLDNQKSNLRFCTYQQNNANRKKNTDIESTTPYKGVLKTTAGTYCSKISFNNRSVHIGVFLTPEEAAVAYNIKAKELFAEFACLNDVPNMESIQVKLYDGKRTKKLKCLSKLPGVYYDKSRDKWICSVYIGNRKSKSIGRFDSEFDAYIAYQKYKGEL